VTPIFPFTAIVGQADLREALLVCAVDPAIGGVLVRGERGTAKSTAVRALAPLLPPVRVYAGSRYAIDPDGAEADPDGGGEIVTRPARLVELPIGATADRVVGTLDLDRALADRARAFEPGLLAAAHRGILYVDEVNLLPDHLVDVLLDAAAMGRNHVEREGISVSHPARFLLVGSMNPEEGELRPQLLDRFGLSVAVVASEDAFERVEVIKRRLAFDADPAAFAARFAGEEAAVAARVATARARLGSVLLGDRLLHLIAGTCARLGVDGLRADIVCARAATALAALDGAAEVGEEHARRAARLALGHRRRRGPFEAPGLDDGELDDALARAGEDLGPDDEPPGGPSGGDGAAPGSAASNGAGRSAGDRERGRQAGTPGAAQAGPLDGEEPAAPGAAEGGPHGGDEAGPDGGDEPRARRGGAAGGRDGDARTRVEVPGAAGVPPLLALAGRGRGAQGRRSRAASGRDGIAVDSRPAETPVGDLALAASLRATALRGDGPLRAADLREHVRAGREGNLVVFCVDTSGSMGAQRRMRAVKGAVLGLLLDAYQRRDRVALVAFRGVQADLVLPPTGSVERAAAVLAALPTGGGTPLAAGLDRAAHLVVAERRREPDRRALALVVTDGRASGGRGGRAAGERAAARLGAVAGGVVVFDAEEGAVRLGLPARLAAAARGRLLPLAALAALTPDRRDGGPGPMSPPPTRDSAARRAA
jgi:magnesium chelatase subunit D